MNGNCFTTVVSNQIDGFCCAVVVNISDDDGCTVSSEFDRRCS
ncbi:hypothetical protein SAMN05216564_1151, partial [Halopenitus persicus]